RDPRRSGSRVTSTGCRTAPRSRCEGARRPADVTARPARLVLLLAVGVAMACGSSDVQRTESSAAGELAAAARTLEAFHHDRLTRPYAEGAFVNYAEQLAALDQAPLPGDLRARWVAARP